MESKLLLLLLLAGFASHGGRATVTYQPTHLKGQGCPSDEDTAQVIETFHSLIEDRVETESTPETRLLAELNTAVEALSQEVANLSDSTTLTEVLEIINEPGLTRALPAESCNTLFIDSPNSSSGNYWIRNSNGTAVQVYCDMASQCCSETTGGWTRIIFLNMTDTNQQCPPAWREITAAGVRTCRRQSDRSCESVNYPSHGISYSRVCGRVTGYQFRTSDAFDTTSSDIDDTYVDGISVTHGSPRQHVWTFASGHDALGTLTRNCPCADNPNLANAEIPSFVENDYFCDTAYVMAPLSCTPIETCVPVAHPLWDGGGCGPDGGCCESNNPPWFCKTLPQPTTDDIEVRICGDEFFSNEDILIELIEIYIF